MAWRLYNACYREAIQGRYERDMMKKSSVGNDLTGVMVLAIGVAAVLGVGVYGTIRYFKGASVPQEESVQSYKRGSTDAIAQAVARDAAVLAEKLPQQQASSYPQFAQVKGSWKVSYGHAGIAVLTLDDGFFQLINTDDPTGARRRYSRGVAKYDPEKGRLHLIPSSEAGAPDPIKGVSYEILTMRDYVFMLSADGANSLYIYAPQETIAGKNYHPLFMFADFNGAPVLKFERTQ